MGFCLSDDDTRYPIIKYIDDGSRHTTQIWYLWAYWIFPSGRNLRNSRYRQDFLVFSETGHKLSCERCPPTQRKGASLSPKDTETLTRIWTDRPHVSPGFTLAHILYLITFSSRLFIKSSYKRLRFIHLRLVKLIKWINMFFCYLLL